MTKIEVTAEDIANGKPGDCGNCPIALSLKRTVPGIDYIEVDGNASYDLDDVRYVARFPESAQSFVERFDAGEPVRPFAFEAEFAPRVYGWAEIGDDE